MVGFVGVKARRRRRNKILFVFAIISMVLIFFYIPSLEFNNEKNFLPNQVLPTENEETTSLISELEELKLAIFQKDQRIKFRDNQIKVLKEEMKNLNQKLDVIKTNYEKALGSYADLENNTSQISSQKINEIENLNKKINNLNNEINKYKNEIDDLKTDIQNSISSDDFQDINIENSILKNELKQLKKNNIYTNEKLNLLNKLLEEKEKEIEKLIYLKDQQHHG